MFNNNLNFWLYFQGHPVDWSKFESNLYIAIVNTILNFILVVHLIFEKGEKKNNVLIVYIHFED